VLAAWNGLLLRGLAEAGRILDRDDYREAALANASFLIGGMAEGGRLHRSWKGGTTRIDAFLEDYAAAINGLLSVYESSGEPRYFSAARAWTDEMLDRFWDEEASSFYDVPRDATPLIGRPRDLSDNATPAGSSLAAEALLRLAAYTGELRYREYAARVLVPLAAAMADAPLGYGHFLSALDDLIGSFYEIAVVGAPDDERTRALLAAVNGGYLPRSVLAAAAPDDASAIAAIPLLAGRTHTSASASSASARSPRRTSCALCCRRVLAESWMGKLAASRERRVARGHVNSVLLIRTQYDTMACICRRRSGEAERQQTRGASRYGLSRRYTQPESICPATCSTAIARCACCWRCCW
jgi:uncharacterized protein YyaL (SSP411 family)